jgi:Lrp/AsnC family transcriptional regulator, regulator for asnA, asnC and gidA
MPMTKSAPRSARVSEGNLRKFPARQPGKSPTDDKLNRAIISALEEDGRTAFSEIADRLKVSEGTIRNRVNAMKEAGLLRIVAIVDPAAAEYKTDAMLGVKVSPSASPGEVAERLAALPNVVYILWVGGRYDLLIEVVTNDKDGFLEFLENEIHGHSDIASAEIMMGLHSFKNQFLLKSNWEDRDA